MRTFEILPTPVRSIARLGDAATLSLKPKSKLRRTLSLICVGLCLGVAQATLAEPRGHATSFGIVDPDPNGQPDDIVRRFSEYKNAGIGILRGGFGWSQFEVEEGRWAAPVRYLDFLGLAKRSGFRLKLTVGAMSAPPRWFLKKNPDAQLVDTANQVSWNVISYWYPGLTGILEDKDQRLFEELRRRDLLSAIDFIIVPFGPASEPIYPAPWTINSPSAKAKFWFCGPRPLAAFIDEMSAKYGTLSKANVAWATDYKVWNALSLCPLNEQSRQLRRDILDWYRDSKRRFAKWQIRHYQSLIAKFFPTNPPNLMFLIPGNHLSAFLQASAEEDGLQDGPIALMGDSEFFIDEAQKAGTTLQYTGLPNLEEIEYLQAYIRRKEYAVAMWGENAWNKGDPQELAQEAFANGLVGQEYVGSGLFAQDQRTPTAKFVALAQSIGWLKDAWDAKRDPQLQFRTLTLSQGGCIYADVEKSVTLCLDDAGVLTLSDASKEIWETKHSPSYACSTDGNPALNCRAIFQGDGNFVIYRGQAPLWSSKTGGKGRTLLFSADGSYLKILDSRNEIVWKPEIDQNHKIVP